MRRDLVCALILLLVAVGYFGLATDINRSALADEVGAHGLPYIYAALLALVALAMALTATLGRHRAAVRPDAGRPHPATTAASRTSLLRSAGAVGLGALYLLLLPLAGYLLATALLLLGMLRYLGEPLGWRMAAIAIGGTTLLYGLFDLVLGISLPPPAGF